MKRFALVLAVALGMMAAAPAAQALPVDITYGLSGVLALPSLGVPAIGPPGMGSMTIRYSAASANSLLATLPLPPGASVGLSSGSVHLQMLTFMQIIAFAFAGDVFSGMVTAAAAPSAVGTLAGGMLSIPGVMGSFMGSIHCTGATCGLAGLPVSVVVPLSGVFGPAVLAALVGPAPGIALAFPLAPVALGSFGGFPITGMLSASEVSRHVTPEPTSAALLGLGLAGLAAFGGWRVRRGRKA